MEDIKRKHLVLTKDRLTRLIVSRAAEIGQPLPDYLRDMALKGDPVLNMRYYSSTPTDGLVQDVIKQAREDSQK